MTEQEMREAEVPWPKTMKELTTYINGLVKQNHDYGTCVYAMSMAATAAFYYVSHELGVTGFQASCADLDILRRTRGYKMGFKIVNFEDLLYPQYERKFARRSITPDTWDNLQTEVKKRLQDKANDHAHPDVIQHWKDIAAGHIPFGLTIGED